MFLDFRRYTFCLKCNLTVHIKYSTTETDRNFDPYIHLIYPEHIMIVSNGFLHMLHIYIDQGENSQQQQQQLQRSQQSLLNIDSFGHLNQQQQLDVNLLSLDNCENASQINSELLGEQKSLSNNVVARIIEDFADFETDSACSGSGGNMNGLLLPQMNSSSNSNLEIAGQRTCSQYLSDPSAELTLMTTQRKNNNCDEFVYNCDLNGSSRNNLNSNNNKYSNHSSALITTSTSTTATSSTNEIRGATTSTKFVNQKLIKNNISNVNSNVVSNLPSKSPTKRHRLLTKFFRRGICSFFSGSTNSTTTISPNIYGNNNNNSNNINSSENNTKDNSNNDDKAASTYEFSEENEKCEKISILRKRRLADRKYEFSEDNSENIIPFTKTRSALGRYKSLFSTVGAGNQSPRSAHNNYSVNVNYIVQHNNSPYNSPSSSPHYQNGSPSPLGGFRSPTSSPSGSLATLRPSPNRHLNSNNTNNVATAMSSGTNNASPATSFYCNPRSPNSQGFKSPGNNNCSGKLSPLQITMTKRSHFEMRAGSMSPNAAVAAGSVPFLSPPCWEDLKASMENNNNNNSITGNLDDGNGGVFSERPICTKKFQRRFVEEDDAASVITSEEGKTLIS